MKALPAPPSFPLLKEGKPENILDNTAVIEFLERLMKEPCRIGEGHQDGESAESPRPIFFEFQRQAPTPFFFVDRHWVRGVYNGQIEADRYRVPIKFDRHGRR